MIWSQRTITSSRFVPNSKVHGTPGAATARNTVCKEEESNPSRTRSMASSRGFPAIARAIVSRVSWMFENGDPPGTT
ncbi:MAG: hypothetical protein ACKO9Z_16505 [Planctomycetota bacterium]